jgi:undecaprenyl pyrophosphate synthase
MKHLFILLIPFLFVACSNKTTPPVAIPKAPIVQESAKPSLEKTQEKIDGSLNENTKIGEGLKDQLDAIKEQMEDTTQALIDAEKIKEKAIAAQLVTEIEAINLINTLKKVETRNLFLEKQNDDLVKNNNIQKNLLEEARKNSKETMDKLIAKENEANQLREGYTFLAENLDKKNKEVESIFKEKEKLIKEKADAMVYKKLFWYAIGLYVLLLIVKNVWMSINPSARLRW